MQLAQKPQGVVTVYPEVVDPLGAHKALCAAPGFLLSHQNLHHEVVLHSLTTCLNVLFIYPVSCLTWICTLPPAQL